MRKRLVLAAAWVAVFCGACLPARAQCGTGYSGELVQGWTPCDLDWRPVYLVDGLCPELNWSWDLLEELYGKGAAGTFYGQETGPAGWCLDPDPCPGMLRVCDFQAEGCQRLDVLPSNPHPANGQTLVDVNVTVSWDPVPGAAFYKVFGLPGGPYETTGTSLTPPALAFGKSYSWGVRAEASCGSVNEAWFSFSTRPAGLTLRFTDAKTMAFDYEAAGALDVAAGSLSNLSAKSGYTSLGPVNCVANNTGAMSMPAPATSGTGAWFYVARPALPGQNGYGASSCGEERRALSGGDCSY